MFLDPLAAKAVLGSELNVTLIPLSIQRRVSSFVEILNGENRMRKTPESRFAYRLLSTLSRLRKIPERYLHTVMSSIGKGLDHQKIAGACLDLSRRFKMEPKNNIGTPVNYWSDFAGHFPGRNLRWRSHGGR